MTPDQAAQVLAALTAAWPSHDMPDETIRLWVGLLADVDQADAMAAAKTVVREDRFFPPISRYLQACEERAHARRNREAADRGLPSGPQTVIPQDQVKDLVARIRRTMSARGGARGHWHGGPGPCDVCGGLAEQSAARPAARRTQRPITGEPLHGCGLPNCHTCAQNTPPMTPTGGTP